MDWLRERTIPERVADAHSLYVETASELGLIGLAALALLIGGTAAAPRAPSGGCARRPPAPWRPWPPSRFRRGSTGIGRCRP